MEDKSIFTLESIAYGTLVNGAVSPMMAPPAETTTTTEPIETTTTTEPEQLSGETYTYTQFRNTVTLVCETRVYNYATNDYTYEYADDETLFVHIEHSSTLTTQQIVASIEGSAVETAGGVEVITLENETSYSREFTGGYKLSVYDSEGWLIDRNIKEVREGSIYIIASDVNGNDIIPEDSACHQEWDADRNCYKIINNRTGQVIGYAPTTTADQIKDFVDLIGAGVGLAGGIRFAIRNVSNSSNLERNVTTFMAKYVTQNISRSVIKCIAWGLRIGVVLTVIDCATYVYTYFFTDRPRFLTDIIIDALFGEDYSYSVNGTSGNTQGGSTGSGNSGSGGGGYSVIYDNNNNEMTIILEIDNTQASGAPEYTYCIEEVKYQTNSYFYTPEYGWGVVATMHTVGFSDISGMGNVSYLSENSLADAITIPSCVNGLSTVGRYSVKYKIYENGNYLRSEWKEFDIGETITSTPFSS